MDSARINNHEEFAYAIMTLDRALDEQIPNWSEWELNTEAPINEILKEIKAQRQAPQIESDYDGLITIPWTDGQLDALEKQV